MEWKAGFFNKDNGVSSAETLGPLHDQRSRERFSWNGWGNNESTSDNWGTAQQQQLTNMDTNSSSGSGWGWKTPAAETDSGGWDKPVEIMEQAQEGWGESSEGATAATMETTTEISSSTRTEGSPPSLFPLDERIKGSPKNVLSEWYLRRHEGHIITDECYVVKDIGDKHQAKFVAIFTCPLTGERFISGRWGDGKTKRYKYSVEEMPALPGNGGVAEEERDSTVQVIWYTRMKNAEHAAAARALDCLAFRFTEGNEYYALCKNQPYMSAADAAPLPRCMMGENGLAPIDPTFASTRSTSRTQTTPPPKSELMKFYVERFYSFQEEIDFKSYFSSWDDNGPAHEQKFTSVYSCPITGEQFLSGKWGDDYVAMPEEGPNGSVVVVWYGTKKQAEHAAAARALDCMRLRRLGIGNDVEDRLCLESPYDNVDKAPPLPFIPVLQTRTIHNLAPRLPPDEAMSNEEVLTREEYRTSRGAPST